MNRISNSLKKKPLLWLLGVLIAAGLLIGGWILWADTAEAPGTGQETEETGVNQRYIGLDGDSAMDLAESEDRDARVVHRDGEDLPATMDLRPRRMNLWIEDGEVVRAETDEEMGNTP